MEGHSFVSILSTSKLHNQIILQNLPLIVLRFYETYTILIFEVFQTPMYMREIKYGKSITKYKKQLSMIQKDC